jgi:DNA primase
VEPVPHRGWDFFSARGCFLADERVALVKQANDIVDVVGAYVALRPAGAKYKGLCPFHEDHRPSLDVDPRRQNFRCWACGKYGDVITFIQEHERVDFREALELLARRAGITLEKKAGSPHASERALMLDVVKWAAEQYQRCLLDSPLAENARRYLSERHFTEDTIHRFALGYAPATWEWLTQRAAQAGKSVEVLEKVGLVAPRDPDKGPGYYDRFRDRIMFPIQARGQTVGFGGRILPNSPFADRGPKYYNSCETPLFRKSEQLYGLDQARQAAASVGYLAVVEGYTDVLMAHQMGVQQVVATMGTALNPRHVQYLRRFVPRVVLVFDADAGGHTGVDRALDLFVSHDVDLAIATLPEGLDPFDLLVQQGPEPFKAALHNAVDALEYKLNQVLSAEEAQGIEGKRRAADSILGIMAHAPGMPGQDGAIKQQLIVTRIAQRLLLKEETVWARLRELRARVRARAGKPAESESAESEQAAPAAPEERELLQVLLVEPALVARAAHEIRTEAIQHPGLRELLEGLYALHAEGEPATLDLLRARIDNPRLAAKALELQEVGRLNPDPGAWLRNLLDELRRKRQVEPQKQELLTQLHATRDEATAKELFRRLQNAN